MAELNAAWRQPQCSGMVWVIAGLRAVVEKRACSGSGTAIWWQVGMHVILASMSSIFHQLAFALHAWDVCARQRYPCVRCALRTLRPSVHDATAVPPSAVASSTV